MKVVKEEEDIISASKMKCGQIAVIVSDPYCGEVVQRYENILIGLGKGSGDSWTTALTAPECKIQVRILRPGTVLEIQ